MLLQDADLLNNGIYQILETDGTVKLPDWTPPLSLQEIQEVYRNMIFAREADLMAVSYQRQGRMYTYPPNFGQEAVSAAAARVIKKEDWLVPAFRELGAWLAKGASLKEIFLYFRGHEDASRFTGAPKMFPIAVPIASQLPHAAGIGYALRLKGEKNAVFAFVGDGGTSEGDFHEALNFAAVWKAPVVFIVQNNQFAISVPFKHQTASANIAVKALAYGIKGVKVDGNDFFAMYDALSESAEYVKKGDGPVLIEALTYRRGAHTTSDDPTKYRTREEEQEWEIRDPVTRLGAYLRLQGAWNGEETETLKEEYRREIDRQFAEAEDYGDYKLEDVFHYMYEEIPPGLRQQQIEYEKYLRWKERRQ